jgi:hypothetical protein
MREPDGSGYQKHMVRFRRFDNNDLSVGDTFVELVMTNSHDGKSSFQFMAGLFRLACSNGLTVSQSTFDNICMRHTDYSLDNMTTVVGEVVNKAPLMLDTVREYQSIKLTPAESEVFAKSAIPLRFEPEQTVYPKELLRPRRNVDADNSLWTTLNVVQENIIRGGVRAYSTDENGRQQRRRSREVRAIDSDIKLNRSLWTLAEEMRKIKTA